MIITIPDTILTNQNIDSHRAFVTRRNKNDVIVNRSKLESYWEDGTGVINEYDNVPVTGIKILPSSDNKKDNRVYLKDPRGFIVKFPAYVLADMLSTSSYNPATGFTSEFVYGFDAIGSIYFISTDSDEYKRGIILKNSPVIQSTGLIPGHYYIFPDNSERLYLGKHPLLNVDRSEMLSAYIDGITYCYEYTVDDVHMFLTSNNVYKIISESDIRDLEFTESPFNVPVPQSRLDIIMEYFYRETGGRPDHFGVIARMVPNIGPQMSVCNPGSRSESLYSRYWLFSEDYRKVTVYDMFNRDYVYIKSVYDLAGKCLISRMKPMYKPGVGGLNDGMLLSALIDLYASTGRLYVSDMEFPLQNRCLVMETDTGYKFSPYTNLTYIFIMFRDNMDNEN